MEKAIIGKKVGMTQVFDEAGRVIPVTLIQAGPCTVVQKKTAEKDSVRRVDRCAMTVLPAVVCSQCKLRAVFS